MKKGSRRKPKSITTEWPSEFYFFGKPKYDILFVRIFVGILFCFMLFSFTRLVLESGYYQREVDELKFTVSGMDERLSLVERGYFKDAP